MPPIRRNNSRKPPPPGFSDLEDTLLSFSNKMKDAQTASHEGKKRHETVWPIMQISHQRSRYIYDLYYGRRAMAQSDLAKVGGQGQGQGADADADADADVDGDVDVGAAGGRQRAWVGPPAISKQLYDYLLKNGYADAALIAKWKKQGYEKLCCLKCVQTRETNFSSTCICRVPKATLERGEEKKADGVQDQGGMGKGREGGTGGAKVIQCVNCGCRGCASAD